LSGICRFIGPKLRTIEFDGKSFSYVCQHTGSIGSGEFAALQVVLFQQIAHDLVIVPGLPGGVNPPCLLEIFIPKQKNIDAWVQFLIAIGYVDQFMMTRGSVLVVDTTHERRAIRDDVINSVTGTILTEIILFGEELLGEEQEVVISRRTSFLVYPGFKCFLSEFHFVAQYFHLRKEVSGHHTFARTGASPQINTAEASHVSPIGLGEVFLGETSTQIPG
jgi:hypothetical protein